MRALSEPRIIERGPYKVVGAYCAYAGDDEGPGWTGAEHGFFPRRLKIQNRTDNFVLGFLYRPHVDHPDVPESVKACFQEFDLSITNNYRFVLQSLQAAIGKLSVLRYNSFSWVCQVKVNQNGF